MRSGCREGAFSSGLSPRLTDGHLPPWPYMLFPVPVSVSQLSLLVRTAARLD